MKKITILFTLIIFSLASYAQEKKLYNPQADATADIEVAVKGVLRVPTLLATPVFGLIV